MVLVIVLMLLPFVLELLALVAWIELLIVFIFRKPFVIVVPKATLILVVGWEFVVFLELLVAVIGLLESVLVLVVLPLLVIFTLSGLPSLLRLIFEFKSTGTSSLFGGVTFSLKVLIIAFLIACISNVSLLLVTSIVSKVIPFLFYLVLIPTVLVAILIVVWVSVRVLIVGLISSLFGVIWSIFKVLFHFGEAFFIIFVFLVFALLLLVLFVLLLFSHVLFFRSLYFVDCCDKGSDFEWSLLKQSLDLLKI